MPANFSDYIIEGKYKYGIERSINYYFVDDDTRCFVCNLDKTVEPKKFEEASSDPDWVRDMNEEMEALYTWDMTSLPKNRKPTGCKWVYRIKYKPNEELERYKARLIAKGFN